MFIKARIALQKGKGLNDKVKLFIMAAYSSRPRLNFIFKPILSLFIAKNVINVSIKYFTNTIRTQVRLKHFSSDYLSITELVLDNCYQLPINISPDLIVDGGGNTGLFTILCNKIYSNIPVLLFEPVKENIEIINTHLILNNAVCKIYNGIISLKEGGVPFYIRNANNSSFDNIDPYTTEIEVISFKLSNILVNYSFNNALIKLDIEGSEVEVIPDLLKSFGNKNLHIVGELHHWPKHIKSFKKIVKNYNYHLDIYNEDNVCVLFHIYRSK